LTLCDLRKQWVPKQAEKLDVRSLGANFAGTAASYLAVQVSFEPKAIIKKAYDEAKIL